MKKGGVPVNKHVRVLIAAVLAVAILFAARNSIAWAGPGADVETSVLQRGQGSVSGDKPDPGSVKPPPGDLTLCEDGIHSIGGVATLEVTELAPGYCLVAFLRNHAFAIGRIPDGAGSVLAQITFLRVFYHGKLVYELPVEDGQAELCYAIPPGKTAQLYFFDFYGPRFGERKGQPSWELLETDVEGGIACAASQTTGAYGLIGQ
jgi:hypothetical protein